VIPNRENGVMRTDRHPAIGVLVVSLTTAWWAFLATPATSESWQGVGPEGGSAYGLAIDPAAPHTLYALAGLGLYKTTNGGQRWFHVDAALLPGPVLAVAVAPSRPLRVYASVGGTIFRSDDAGATWSSGVATGAFTVATLAVDPQEADTVYATGSTGQGGVFASRDGGRTWAQAGLASRFVYSLSVDPHQPATIYAGTDRGVWKSTNSARSWQAAAALITPASPVTVIAVDPLERRTLYAAGAGIYVSRNGGASWRQLLAPTATPGGVACLIITSAPGRPIYACAGGLLKSSDHGERWLPLDGGLGSHKVSAAIADPSSPDRLYAAVFDSGISPGPAIYKTIDAGATWLPSGRGVVATFVSSLVVDPLLAGTLYSSVDGSVLKTVDDGSHWAPVDSGLRGNQLLGLAIDPLQPSILYAQTNRAFFRSEDGGASWVRPGVRFTGGPRIVVDPQSPGTLYSISRGAGFRSFDAGASWTEMTSLTGVISDLAISPSQHSTLYATAAVGSGLQLEVSHDGGSTFETLPRHGVDSALGGVVVDPTNPEIVYVVGTEEIQYSQSFDNLYKSENGGKTFSILLDANDLRALLIDPRNPAVIYASTTNFELSEGLVENRLVFSTDGGASWNDLSGGLPGAIVLQLALDSTGALYAATAGSGIYKLSSPPPAASITR